MTSSLAHIDLKLVAGERADVEALPHVYASDRSLIAVTDTVTIGDNRVVVMAGPCSVESAEHIHRMAPLVAASGARMLRGGAFKPRTSPYSFQGLGVEGLEFLHDAGNRSDLPVVSEVTDVRQIESMLDRVAMFQVGARNMFNYQLLKELGAVDKPVLLKRSMMATIDEFLGAAEYILSRGNARVVLCERGIRSFDSQTRFCLDLSAVPVLRERSKLPIIIDPSHATGVARFVEPMALAAVAAGADGLLIEVHDCPEEALSDGRQSLSVAQFQSLMPKLRRVAHAIGRSV